MEQDSHLQRIIRYYARRESRWGYQLVLGGRRHFGYSQHNVPVPRLRASMKRMEDKLGDALRLPPGSRVLDAGCGEGFVAEYLYQTRGLRVDGIDLVELSIGRARQRTQESNALGFQVADYNDIPFPDDTFDAVYTMETLVHADDHKAALQELRRVLKPGGRIVCLEYSMFSRDSLTVEEAMLFDAINEGSAMASFGTFVKGKFPEIFRSAGFEHVHVRDMTRNIEPMLRFFWTLGIVPYSICRIVGKRFRFINVMSGVELYNMRRKWQYNLISAKKPNR
jgi:sterol 24-C-methyltransferase